MREYARTACTALLSTVGVIFCIGITSAQVMQSTNYRIQSDSLNFGGGLSSSTSYVLESTAGEVATGESSSASFKLKAGYQQLVTNFISMTAPDDVTMTPSIPGVSGGTSNGSTTVTVTTDSPAGYELSIKATASPAMTKGSDTIADYVPVDGEGDPDYNFTTGATDAHFGYSPSSIDTTQRFLGIGAVGCNFGSTQTALTCWDGLSITDVAVSRSSSANTPSGATTTVYFRVGIGGSVSQAPGTYTATTTLTALAL